LAPSHLCVHAEFGPWIALRAAVVLDAPGGGSTPAEPTCDCPSGCLPALERALAAGEPTNGDELRDHWTLWLAMRDACPRGRAHRYGDEQIRYHYVGERPPGWPAIDTVGDDRNPTFAVLMRPTSAWLVPPATRQCPLQRPCCTEDVVLDRTMGPRGNHAMTASTCSVASHSKTFALRW
jgi:hypothetical protein